jgi:hypothetical protein
MEGISRTSPRVVAPSFLARMVAVFYLVLLSLCAAYFSLTGCIVQAFALVFHLAPFLPPVKRLG